VCKQVERIVRGYVGSLAVPESTNLPARAGRAADAQALDAQTALLPYALGCFAATLPFYVWAGSHAANAAWMAGSFVIFAIAWGAFYGIVNWLKQPAAENLKSRGRVQIMGGLLWAGAIAQSAAFADGAGPARETLLLASLAASAVCVVFTAPWLPSLLIVAPVAVAGPLIGLFARPESQSLAKLGWGAVALSLALALLVNRILRMQFALAAEREVLIVERAEQAEAAERLARSKSNLIATLSDEIRNGLTGVAHTLAAAAGRGGRAAPSREQLASALDAANDLLAVLNTTLDAETAEAGRLTVDTRPIDLPTLARDLVAAHRPSAVAKGLEIGLHVAPDLAAATTGATLADAIRVRQALEALIGNAVKFTIRGRVEVRVSLTDARRVAVEVADTGPGLSESDLTVAFEPFQQVARTSAGTYGAGLGLTLAHRLAGLMGGQLRAESAMGVGSCFTLELPYDPAAPRGSHGDAVASPEPAQVRPMRILLIEDDQLHAASVRMHLEHLGHKVLPVADARRGLELARSCELDVAMVSASLQTLEAPLLIADLRALGGVEGEIPVLAMIGGEGSDAEACVAAGARAVVRKPANAPALARALSEACATPPLSVVAGDRQVA
jgi:signal transduction histidine kinase/ActR/RegA family two-component response regulator